MSLLEIIERIWRQQEAKSPHPFTEWYMRSWKTGRYYDLARDYHRYPGVGSSPFFWEREWEDIDTDGQMLLLLCQGVIELTRAIEARAQKAVQGAWLAIRATASYFEVDLPAAG